MRIVSLACVGLLAECFHPDGSKGEATCKIRVICFIVLTKSNPWSSVSIRGRLKSFREARKPPPSQGGMGWVFLYAIASLEIRFSEKSLAISFLSLASGRKTMRWPFTMLEGENSFWAITSAE